jgi:hypothetical protein
MPLDRCDAQVADGNCLLFETRSLPHSTSLRAKGYLRPAFGSPPVEMTARISLGDT